MALLEVTNLRTYFDTRDGILRAVDGVTFQVSAGETLALVGESGSGKSVTARSLMRLVSKPGRIIGGQVVFDGHDVLKMNNANVRALRGRSMAMIFQDPMASLNPALTIGKQISEAVEVHGKRDRKRTLELLDLVGIPNPKQRVRAYPHEFSGGMRQRVMIAMALSCNPKLILADEVTTALDVTIQAQILDLLKDVTRDLGAAFLFITHDLGIVARMAQRVHIMYAGQIIETATTSELFANPRMPYTWGLLRSLPRLDEERRVKLRPIEGMPPDLTKLPDGCRFEPRCQYRREICRTKDPDLLSVPKAAPSHTARCWGTQNVPEGGWLIDVDWRRESGNNLPAEPRKNPWASTQATCR